jgi:hypothetical protein
MHEPSVMNKLRTSCAWLRPFSTEVAGSCPMRAVPISWTEWPGGWVSPSGATFSNPAAVSICIAS